MWTWFRKTFVWTPGTDTTAVFAADPTARAWLNGNLILDRTQRFVSPHIPFERLELAPVLRKGINVLVVLHHWWGVPTFQRSPGGAPGIAFGGDCVRTDTSWQWRNADEFISHPHQTIGHDGARRIRFPVLLDLEKEDPGIHSLSADTTGWQPVSMVVHAAWARPVPKETPHLALDVALPRRVINFGEISPATVPTQPHEVGRRMREAIHHPSASAAVGLSVGAPLHDTAWSIRAKRGYVCLDFGKPVHGYPRLSIDNAPAGAVIEIGYAELAINPLNGVPLLKPDGSFDPEFVVGSPFGDRARLRSGKQTVEIPDERTWRWLLIHWETPQTGQQIEFSGVSCITSQHPVVQIGSFESSDARLDSLIKLCLGHARITMSDTYVDTTGREDAQWLEDIQYRARLAATWFGDASLRQVTLRHAVEQQDPATGLFRVFAPEDHAEAGCQFLDWGMTWIGLLHDDWLWTGETTRVRRYFAALRTFLDALHRLTGADGLLTGENTLGDLRTSLRADYAAGGRESIPNAWYHGYLRQAAEMADAIGEDDYAEAWSLRARRVRENFRRFETALANGAPTVAETWAPHTGPVGLGQAAVVSAIFHGLVEGETARAMLAAAFVGPAGAPPPEMKRWNTPTYIYRVLRCLCEHGLGAIAREHLFSIYAPYLPDGPLPEYFLPGEGQPADPTGSHGWAAVPLAWLHDTVLGVRHRHNQSTNPPKAHPYCAGWEKVAGVVVTPAGPIQVHVDWSAKKIDVRAPEEARAPTPIPPTANHAVNSVISPSSTATSL